MERHNRERWYRMATSWLAAAPHPHSKTSSHAGLYIWCNFGRWHVKYKTSRTVDFSWIVVHLSPTKISFFFFAYWFCLLCLLIYRCRIKTQYMNRVQTTQNPLWSEECVAGPCGIWSATFQGPTLPKIGAEAKNTNISGLQWWETPVFSCWLTSWKLWDGFPALTG